MILNVRHLSFHIIDSNTYDIKYETSVYSYY